jgi:glycosyltransferase 2 family protein
VNPKLKRVLWHVARLLIVVGLVAFVLSRSDLRKIAEIAKGLAENWPWTTASVVFLAAQAPLSAFRWRMLLAVQDVRITFGESLRLTYLGWFFNNWMPGATGGDILKAYYIAARTHKKTEAVTVVFLDRVIGLVALCMLGGAAVFVNWGDPDVRIPQVAVSAFLAASLAGGVVFYSQRIRHVLKVSRFLKWLPVWSTLQRINDAIFVYRYQKKKVLVSVACSWFIQALGVLSFWQVATALGSRADWYNYFVIVPVIWIVWSLIPVPGGFGVAEVATRGLFTAAILGVDNPQDALDLALTIILAFRVVQWAVSLPGAVVYLAQRTAVSPTHMREAMEAPEPDA